MTPVEAFNREMAARLKEMHENPRPLDMEWPDGCYGSARSILLFVGPSPGGKPSVEDLTRQRTSSGGRAFWGERFTEPYDDSPERWGAKYSYSISTYIKVILCVSLDEAAQLYGFANFDWVPAPRESIVSGERMTAGEEHVLRVLSLCNPHIVVPLTKAAALRLSHLLAKSYKLIPPQRCDVVIRASARSFHRELDVYRLEGSGVLNGCVVIRSPQHPNRMLNRAHAERCARAIRQAFEQVLADATAISVRELGDAQ